MSDSRPKKETKNQKVEGFKRASNIRFVKYILHASTDNKLCTYDITVGVKLNIFVLNLK